VSNFFLYKYGFHVTEVYVVFLQVCLDNGCFIHQISYAKVHRPIMTSSAVAGMSRRSRNQSSISGRHYLFVRAFFGK